MKLTALEPGDLELLAEYAALGAAHEAAGIYTSKHPLFVERRDRLDRILSDIHPREAEKQA